MEFKQKNTKILFLVFIFIFIVVYALSATFLQAKSYNIMNKLTINNKHASNDVVLVTIDDKSLLDIGRWPWKREYYLEMFDYFESYTNAKLIGYDGLVMAPDLEHPQSDKNYLILFLSFRREPASPLAVRPPLKRRPRQMQTGRAEALHPLYF